MNKWTAKWDLVFKDISTVIIRFRDFQLYQYPNISGRVGAVLLILLKKTFFLVNKVFWFCDSSCIVQLGALLLHLNHIRFTVRCHWDDIQWPICIGYLSHADVMVHDLSARHSKIQDLFSEVLIVLLKGKRNAAHPPSLNLKSDPDTICHNSTYPSYFHTYTIITVSNGPSMSG